MNLIQNRENTIDSMFRSSLCISHLLYISNHKKQSISTKKITRNHNTLHIANIFGGPFEDTNIITITKQVVLTVEYQKFIFSFKKNAQHQKFTFPLNNDTFYITIGYHTYFILTI